MIKIGKEKKSLSLSMIVKDETETLETALKSVAKYVDEIVVNWNGSNQETEKILKKYNAIIVRKEWNGNFSDARKFAWEHTTGDYVIWLDADDEVIHPEKIPFFMNMAFGNPAQNNGAIWTNWHYSHDDKGNITSEFYRERIVNRKWFKWDNSRLHEGLHQTVFCEHAFLDPKDMWIYHNATDEQIAKSQERNLAIIIEQYEKEHKEGDIDAKTTLDCARSLMGAEMYNEALKVFAEYVETSGWDNERAHAFFMMADIYRKHKKWESALMHDAMGEKLKPSWPDGYIGRATTLFCQERWEECVDQLVIAKSLKPPYGLMPCDRTSYDLKPWIMLAQCYINLGKTELAIDMAERALQNYPDNKVAKGLKGVAMEMLKNEDIVSAVLHLKSRIEASKYKVRTKLKHLLKAIPPYGVTHPAIRRLETIMNGKPKDNRLVIFCGTQVEAWDPTFVNKGIGGSEEAVINIGKELVKLGWNVDVYCECLNEGIYDGVNYQNYDVYLKNQPCKAYISWRMASYMDFAPEKGEQRILWCHDVQKPEYYSEKHLKLIDKIFMLSKYHRSNLAEFPEEKFMYTANGIDPAHFGDPAVFPTKIPDTFIYASSPDRGLDIALDLWPEILKIKPKAQLHIYYGFTKNYDEAHKNDAARRKFKEDVMNNMKQQGVFYHGMVGHKELADAYMKSQYWIYPCYFAEISCISAMKAQAAGCYPLTTDVAAMKETVQYGLKYDKDITKEENRKDWMQKVLDIVSNGPGAVETAEMRNWALKNYSWENVAKQWDNYLRRK